MTSFTDNWIDSPKQAPLPEVTELEEVTANTWLTQGTIWITSHGSENTYYTDEFDKEYFCKNYPQIDIDQVSLANLV